MLSLRKCTLAEAEKAAMVGIGSKDVHKFKKEHLTNVQSISHYDLFIDRKTRRIYICDKNGDNPEDTYINI